MAAATTGRAQRRRLWPAILLAVLTLLQALAASAASACSAEPDVRPLRQRIADVPLAFVGTVVSVEGDKVRFQVEVALMGLPAAEYAAVVAGSGCSLAFQQGERWLYAGSSLRDPSRKLGDGRLPPSRHVWRLEDDALGLAAWQRCDDSAQCAAIDFGCTLTAAHRDHLHAASQQAWKRGGDPRDLSCVSPPVVDLVLACVRHRCGAWRLGVR